ncbi:hypothetical protein GCM10023189_57510 [Nibrella saemangeumensis]|uniref:Uncharacterized protein n=1 Tax=Nibrella saemangeumensis TaxID=1084526 RepID=A0ABP8NMY1_9BACT
MNTDQTTRYSRSLPELRFSLNLLYVGRLLLGMSVASSLDDNHLEEIDERIEEVTDELVVTELLHEAAVLAGDVLPETPPTERFN